MAQDYKFEHVWKLLNVHQVADILGMNEAIVRKMIRERKIRSYWIGGKYMIREWDLQHYIESYYRSAYKIKARPLVETDFHSI